MPEQTVCVFSRNNPLSQLNGKTMLLKRVLKTKLIKTLLISIDDQTGTIWESSQELRGSHEHIEADPRVHASMTPAHHKLTERDGSP
tara:strand:- start:233 stop:493 length:261 start_codon:yes stop_codon:yes gene_type:complete